MAELVRKARVDACVNRQMRLEAAQRAQAARLEAARSVKAARLEAVRREKEAARLEAVRRVEAVRLEAAQRAEAARLEAAQRVEAKRRAGNVRNTAIRLVQIAAGLVSVSPIPEPPPVPVTSSPSEPPPVPVTSSPSEPPPVPVTSSPSEPPPVLVSSIPGTSSSGDSPVYKDPYMELLEQFCRILRSLNAVELLSVTYDRLLKLAKREELHSDYFVPIQFPHPENQVRQPIADMLSHIERVRKWITGLIIPEFKCFDPLNQADATQDDVDYARKMADAVEMQLWQLADETLAFEISTPQVNHLIWIVQEYTHYFPKKLNWFCCFVKTLPCELWV